MQGNGMAPPGWVAISTVLVNAMRDAGFGYKTWSAISARALEITCFAFVDDTDLIHSIDPDLSTEQLIQESQRVLRTWEELLHTSGGALAPEKSYWHLVEVIRSGNQWKYRQPTDSDGQIFLQSTDDDGQPIPSQRLASSVSKEALGIFANPEGTMDAQVTEMKRKVQLFCDRVRTRFFARHEIWYGFQATIMKTLEYPLAATTLSKTELKQIMAPLLKAVLPYCGYQRLLPRTLLYGTLLSQGAGLADPWVTQLVEHIQVILRHASNRDTPTTDLLVENMELVQVHVGSAQPFWQIPYSSAGFLAPAGWIQHTWEAMEEYELVLQGPLATVSTKRSNDSHLMDIVRDCGKFTEAQMLSINNCRMHLGVTCISDLASISGTRVSSLGWGGSSSPSQVLRSKHWPRTYEPSRSDWELWQSMLQTCVIAPHDTTRKLRQPLGEWLDRNDDSWQWWYSAASDTIWQRTHQGWSQWTPTATQRQGLRRGGWFRPRTYPTVPIHSLPPDAHRIEIRPTRHMRMIQLLALDQQQYHLQPSPESFSQHLSQLPESALWAVERTSDLHNSQHFANALCDGSAIAVSDGSLKEGLGTSAFVLEGRDSTNRIQGVNPVPGPLTDGDSYRCELAGIYASVLLSDRIAKYHHLGHGSALMLCDNISALKVFDPDFVPNPHGASFDLVSAVHNLLRQTPVQWSAQHVKGHQDTKGRILTRYETLNVEMDRRAKDFWHYLVLDESYDMTPKSHPIYKEGWMVYCAGAKISQPSRKALYSQIQDPDTINWWQRHGRFTAVASELIDWHANKQALKKEALGLRRWTTKHASDNCGCGVTLVQWKKQSDDHCPRCCESETTTHILRCPAMGAQAVWDTSIRTLRRRLKNLETHPDLIKAIRFGLSRWRADQPTHRYVRNDEVQLVVNDQDEIGWRNFLEGLWSDRWKDIQQLHYQKIGSRKTGLSWSVKAISAVRLVGYGQWAHRNEIKHQTLRPRHQQMISKLHRAIAAELQQGQEHLPESDTHLFQFNYIDLIERSLNYKQTWLSHVTEARRRYERKRQHNDDLNTISRKRSKLIQWSKSHRAT